MRAHRAADALEREFPDQFDGDGFLYGHQDAGTDQDLTGFGFIA
jgi:hypothetical protein